MGEKKFEHIMSTEVSPIEDDAEMLEVPEAETAAKHDGAVKPEEEQPEEEKQEKPAAQTEEEQQAAFEEKVTRIDPALGSLLGQIRNMHKEDLVLTAKRETGPEGEGLTSDERSIEQRLKGMQDQLRIHVKEMVRNGEDPESALQKIQKVLLKPRREELKRKLHEEENELPAPARGAIRQHITRLEHAMDGDIDELIKELKKAA